MGSMSTLFYCLLYLLTQIWTATAASTSSLEHKDDTPVALSQNTTEPYLPYIYLAGAAYCHLHGGWTCGVYCDYIPDFQLAATGGNGYGDPLWYVGYAPSLDSIIVGHQATNSKDLASVLHDFDIILVPAPPDLFPGAPSDTAVHRGFLDVMSKSASDVLIAVQGLISSTNATKVAVMGHSLGAATATLSSMSLKLHLPSTMSIKFVGLGAPRVGNPAFANLTDTLMSDFHHIANNKDPVPLGPLRRMGYSQPNGEIHISEDKVWFSCPGHDNPSEDCSVGAVPHINDGNMTDHAGPFLDVLMDRRLCQG